MCKSCEEAQRNLTGPVEADVLRDIFAAIHGPIRDEIRRDAAASWVPRAPATRISAPTPSRRLTSGGHRRV